MDDMENMSVKSSCDSLDTAKPESLDKHTNNNQNDSSLTKENKQEEQSDKQAKSNLGKMQAAGGAAHAAHSAISAFNLILLFKSLIVGAAAAAATAGNGIIAFFIAIGKNIVHTAMTWFSTVSNIVSHIFNVSANVATTIVASVSAITCVTASVAVVTTTTLNTAMRDTTSVVDCSVGVNNFIADITGNTDAHVLANAKSVNSVLKNAGFSNVQIAGVLGNLQKESNIDPTSVEGIFDEPFTIGSRKQKAIACNFKLGTYAPEADYDYDYCAGIGLAGFTGPNNEELRSFATANHKNWYDLDLQIAYAIGKYSSAKWLNSTYKTTNYKNVNDATQDFMNEYERPADWAADLSGRQGYAAKWYTLMGEWAVDVTYANSVLAMANTAATGGNNDHAVSLLHDCKSAQTYDNSSLASAAVSYAYETKEQGEGNNGTELYRTVHDNVFPGDKWYQSCDRGVACAVRWSGCDDIYPVGTVGPQLNYCISSDKWQEVKWDGNRDNLQPGDIIFEGANSSDDHTLLYVGNAIIKATYPKADAEYCLVSASLNERSPGCQRWYDASNRRVFRNVKKETDSKYKNAGSSAKSKT